MHDMEIEIEMGNGEPTKEKTTWEKRVEDENGSVTTRVEKVSNGYIKTVITDSRKEGKYKHDVVKSIHEENPMEEKTLVDKLADFIAGKE